MENEQEAKKETLAKNGSKQASVLIRTRLRAPSTRLLFPQNINSEVKGRIINTLVRLKNSGLEEQTVKTIGYYLCNLGSSANISSIFDL